MIKHYEGPLGTFDYDDEEFEVSHSITGNECLHYHGTGSSVDLPEGCINMSYMFYNCTLPEGFTLGDKFDTSKVTNMYGMFWFCQLPEGFTLGDKFNTSKVTNMDYMFYNCTLPEGFTLGDKFDTSKVTNMYGMFWICQLPEGFTLGDKFNTSRVEDMSYMFSYCTLPEGFTLGDKFNTSRVEDMSYMFYNCTLPEGFTLGDKFDTSKVTNMYDMFSNCQLPEGFTLGDKFDTSKVTNTCNMFYNCTLPPEISKYEDPCDIVSWLKVPTKPEVWRILNQGLYEEEFYPQAEKIYDCVKYLVCTCGNITVDGKNVPAMRVLFDMWNNYSNETFKILEALVHESEFDSAPQQMNLF